MEEGTLIAWLKQPGEPVKVGEPLFELEGDKALEVVEAVDEGSLYLPPEAPRPGAVVAVGAVLGFLLAEGEFPPPWPAAAPPTPMPGAQPLPATAGSGAAHARLSSRPRPIVRRPEPRQPTGGGETPPASPAVRRLAREMGVTLSALTGTGSAGRVTHQDLTSWVRQQLGGGFTPIQDSSPGTPRVVASPRARRIAAELGVQWQQLRGTGLSGRIREADVRLAYATAPLAAGRSAPRAPASRADNARLVSAARPESPEPPADPLLNSPRRRAIAERLRTSHARTVPVTLTTTTAVGELVRIRREYRVDDSAPAPSFGDLIGYLAIRVLSRHPAVALCWSPSGKNLIRVAPEEFHLALAVDTPQGLLAPVIRDVYEMSISRLAAESRRLVELARAGRLSADQMQGAVLTVSNLGAWGVEAFTPVINFPQILILGLGAIRRQPTLDAEGSLVAQQQMTLSLTFDHAAIDGAPAAAYLRDVAAALASPAEQLEPPR